MTTHTKAKSAATGDQAHTWRRYKDGDTEWKRLTENIFNAGWSHKCPTYVHRTPPCQGSCPSGHDIRGWLGVVRGMEKPPLGHDGKPMSWQEYAFRRMTDANPFPAIMGRVCPAPCQDGCNRNQVEDFVGINAVEHHVGDWAIANNVAFDAPPAPSGKRVAIIGGGPAGLAAAYHLRRHGHASTIFEGAAQLGGWMRYGIPGYRVPRDVLDAEIKRILDLGDIEVKCDTRVGKDIAIADLESGFDAIFWAIGTQAGKGLPIPGWDAPNCVSGADFLRAFNEGRLQHVNQRIIVIGGGDTSIDVASVARRLGHITEAKPNESAENVVWGHTAHDVASSAMRNGATVLLTSLFPVEKMTAAEREVEDAKHEGVDIRGSVMPLEVIKNDEGRAIALKMCKCDMDGMRPIPQAGTEFTVEADLIVSAIGQKGDMNGLEAMDNGHGFINADKSFAVPGKSKHFVGGDIVRPHLLTTAIGHARVAAQGMDRMFAGADPLSKRPKVDVHHWNLLNSLKHQGLDPQEAPHEEVRGTADAKFAIHNYEDRAAQEIIPHDKLFLGHFPFVDRKLRQEIQIDADKVLGNFEERLRPLSDEEVVAEAKRCMSCGLCFECDNCVVYCPQDAVHRTPKAEKAVGRYVYTDYSRCIGCHICNDVCPTGYIQMGLGEE